MDLRLTKRRVREGEVACQVLYLTQLVYLIIRYREQSFGLCDVLTSVHLLITIPAVLLILKLIL